MTDRNTLRARIQDELVASEEYKLIQRIRTFELSLEVFERNYRELDAAIGRHLPTDVAGIVRLTQDHANRNEEQIEITRLLHNFVAAALTLVDHTRVFHRELYATGNMIPDYQQQIDARFVNDGLANFVKCLRQFCQHYRLPLISTSLTIDAERGRIESGVRLRKSDLLQFSSWTAPARRFVDSMADEVDLHDLLNQYRQQILDFYRWFTAEQHRVHKAAFDYYQKCVNEIDRLGKPA